MNEEITGMSNPNIKEITVKLHINEKTGKLVNVTRGDNAPGKTAPPQGEVTDCTAFVISKNSPSCVYYLINGVWYCFC